MKKIVMIVLMFMMFMGVVSASNINGEYKGSPIVKVTSGGQEIVPADVPAMVLDGRTVVPISLLKKLGATVIWNADDYSVDVKLPETEL